MLVARMSAAIMRAFQAPDIASLIRVTSYVAVNEGALLSLHIEHFIHACWAKCAAWSRTAAPGKPVRHGS